MRFIKTITCFLFILLKAEAQCPWSFSITNAGTGQSLTCVNSSVQLSVSHNNSNTVNFNWTGPGYSASSTLATLVQPGTYTILAVDAITSCSLQQTYTVFQNTATPIFSASPISQTLNCLTAPNAYTAVALSPTSNIVHQIFFPTGGGITNTNPTFVFAIIPAPGTYTYVLTNQPTGCSATQTFLILQNSNPPSYSLSSPTNYQVNCPGGGSLSINAVATSTPSGSLSYTIVPNGLQNSVPSGIILGNNPNLSVSAPGTYVVIIQDNSNFCRSSSLLSFSNSTPYPSFSHTVGANGVVNFAGIYTASTGATSYSWDYGDGITGNGPTSSHTYSNGGIHQAQLFTNNPSCVSYLTPVDVNTIPCNANSNFTLVPSGIPLNWFALPSYFGNVINALWQWGDGSSSTGLYPSHVYASAGIYTICLTVTASCANTATTCSGYSIFKTPEVSDMIRVKALPSFPTSVKTIDDLSQHIHVFPIPSEDFVEIQNQSNLSLKATLYNINGIPIREFMLRAFTEETLNDLQPGLYYLLLREENQTIIKKILIINKR